MKTGKRGVSLIVLVITIIVMTILAGAVVLTLSDTGIMDRAEEAVEKTNLKQVQELAGLGWAEAYTNGAREIADLKAGVTSILQKNGVDVSKYNIKVTTSGVKVTAKETVENTIWTQEGLTITKGNQVLTIGDTIEYDETNGGKVTGLTDVTWKILGANDAGELLILSADDVATDVTIAGSGSFSAISQIDESCAVYAQGEGALSARSVKVEDINKVTGYVPEEALYGLGGVNEYGNRVTYSWTGGENPTYTSENGSGTLNPANEYATYFTHGGTFRYYEGTAFKTSTNDGATEESPITITTLESNYYSYYPTTLTDNSGDAQNGIATTTKAYKMIFRNSADTANADYWLSSSGISTNTDQVTFYIRQVNAGRVVGEAVDRSFTYSGMSGAGTSAIRAVVILSSDVILSGSSTSGWKIE